MCWISPGCLDSTCCVETYVISGEHVDVHVHSEKWGIVAEQCMAVKCKASELAMQGWLRPNPDTAISPSSRSAVCFRCSANHTARAGATFGGLHAMSQE